MLPESVELNELKNQLKEFISSEREDFCLLLCGPRGVKWLRKDDVIDINNPVIFTCAECRRDLVVEGDEHAPGCKVAMLNALGM